MAATRNANRVVRDTARLMPTIHYANGTNGEYESATIRENGWVEAHRNGSAVHIPPGQVIEIDGVVSYT